MILSPWLAVLLALPVLLLGERLVRAVWVLRRFNLPAPVVGGLLVSGLVLLGNLTGIWPVKFASQVSSSWWTWLVTPEHLWLERPARGINLPFLVGFFTCIGLNASWSLLRRGSLQVLLFLGVASALAVLQNLLGLLLARGLGVSPLLGLMCGSVTMTGGHGTALGFASEFERAGLPAAGVLGVAAATFGLVAGGLLGGPVGGGLIRRFRLRPAGAANSPPTEANPVPPGVFGELRALCRPGRNVLAALLTLAVCIKLGAWVSFGLESLGLTFPVYIGAMLVGVLVRNGVEACGGRWLRTDVLDAIGAVLLGIFLSVAMMSLNLIELADAAVPMLVICTAQAALMGAFAWWVTFRVMGRDFDAAVMAGGHCGFGLGATPNAIANMKALVENFGPAPRAFLVVPLVGAFLIDFVNALNLTLFLNLLKP
jgi:ESS family glutamate:Na+ symporter